MKMHAEKKHKCLKCNNGYSTEWDLKRHIEDCGKTYRCTCGCPYASRAALLSHVYRMGHEIPTEHRHVVSCIHFYRHSSEHDLVMTSLTGIYG